MRAFLILSLAIAIVPSATAAAVGCHADLVCVSDSQFGDCDAEGYEAGSTVVTVAGVAAAGGSYECYGGSVYGGGTSGVFVSTPAGSASWSELHYNDPENGAFRGCWIQSGEFYRSVPCSLAAPPNPGWGTLLP